MRAQGPDDSAVLVSLQEPMQRRGGKQPNQQDAEGMQRGCLGRRGSERVGKQIAGRSGCPQLSSSSRGKPGFRRSLFLLSKTKSSHLEFPKDTAQS